MGLAHGGMLRAAQKLDEQLHPTVEAALCKLNGPRRVLLIGHSLGAGVATLLTSIWHDSGRLPSTELQCIAFACPQVLDADLANIARNHTTSFVVGEDVVPCLSLATATELRDAVLLLASAECPDHWRPKSIFEAATRGETAELAAIYAEVRARVVGVGEVTSIARLYPAGRVLRLPPGSVYAASLGVPVPPDVPREIHGDALQEMVITGDMALGHLPRRYLAAVREVAADAHTVALWGRSEAAC